MGLSQGREQCPAGRCQLFARADEVKNLSVHSTRISPVFATSQGTGRS